MQIPIIRGTIDRRILVNYRVDPAALRPLLPAPFRPKLIDGFGMAGICLIRLKGIRPRLMPLPIGVGSENAAHRIAVEWDEGGATREGVYIPRRDTNSRLNTLVGGRLFPGEHHRARFETAETATSVAVRLASADGQVRVDVAGSLAVGLPESSIFPSLQAASDFFANGSLSYSATRQPGRFDGLALHTNDWRVAPLSIERLESSFFSDRRRFPDGALQFDCALLMRNIAHEWHGAAPMRGGDCDAACL